LDSVINDFLASVTLKNLVEDYYKKVKDKKNMYYI